MCILMHYFVPLLDIFEVFSRAVYNKLQHDIFNDRGFDPSNDFTQSDQNPCCVLNG